MGWEWFVDTEYRVAILGSTRPLFSETNDKIQQLHAVLCSLPTCCMGRGRLIRGNCKKVGQALRA